MRSHIVLGLLFLVVPACRPQEIQRPAFAGYVTRVSSASDFDINGQHVVLGPRTTVETVQNSAGGVEHTSMSLAEMKPYYGEAVDIYGELNSKTRTIAANRILLYIADLRRVAGLAIVDAILPLPTDADSATDHLVRADGYAILLTPKAKITFIKPLAPNPDIHVNLWISYNGRQREDGVVLADKVDFSKNIISHGEDKLREGKEYDPSAVSPDKKQSFLSKQVRGIDPKQIPPYSDAAMQARVSAIGARLIPKYQVDFPYTEETRIDFRFQVIDSTKWHDAFTLPNGIILVPYQVVERMQNDSQLATVLADNIACALEKQPLYSHEQAVDLSATNIAGDAVGLIIPGAGIATSLATGMAAARQRRLNQEQSGRVSLSLLHDAGYDIQQAPLAWWRLASKKPEDINKIPLPRRAAYLFQFLGENSPSPAFATTMPVTAASDF